jgi:photosystem II stability/assembly factor-like uncharacterized protein
MRAIARLCPFIAILGLMGQAGPQPATLHARAMPATGSASGAWSVVHSFPGPQPALTNISCGTRRHCFALASSGGLLATTDAGRTWKAVAGPRGTFSEMGLRCVSAGTCFIVGRERNRGLIARTTDGGARWKLRTVRAMSEIDGVDCPTRSRCFAVGEAKMQLWTFAPTLRAVAHKGGKPAGRPGAVILGSNNGGLTWRPERVPGNVALDSVGLNNVNCPTTLKCVAVGFRTDNLAEILMTFDGGTSWTRVKAPRATRTLSSVACPSVSACYAVGPNQNADQAPPHAYIISTSDGGAIWKKDSLLVRASSLNGISCASVRRCVATGVASDGHAGIILVTRSSGRKWKRADVPPSINGLGGVECLDRSRCISVGSQLDFAAAIILSRDGGLDWTTAHYRWTILGGLTCPTTEECLVGGLSSTGGAVYATRDAGTTWNAQRLPTNVGSVAAFTCSTSNTCFAWGKTRSQLKACQRFNSVCGNNILLKSTTARGSWRQVRLPAGVKSPQATACPSAKTCYVVAPGGWDKISASDGAILKTTTGGSKWSVGTIPGMGNPYGIACASDVRCVVSGNVSKTGTGIIETTADGGANWTKSTGASGRTRISDVACPSAAVCFATGGSVNQRTFFFKPELIKSVDGGATWTTPSLPKGSYVLGGIACASISVCIVAGGSLVSPDGGNTFYARALTLSTTNGSTWRFRDLPPATVEVSGISCPAIALCLGSVARAGRPFPGSDLGGQESDIVKLHP